MIIFSLGQFLGVPKKPKGAPPRQAHPFALNMSRKESDIILELGESIKLILGEYSGKLNDFFFVASSTVQL
jgi:hypothetical protein